MKQGTACKCVCPPFLWSRHAEQICGMYMYYSIYISVKYWGGASTPQPPYLHLCFILTIMLWTLLYVDLNQSLFSFLPKNVWAPNDSLHMCVWSVKLCLSLTTVSTSSQELSVEKAPIIFQGQVGFCHYICGNLSPCGFVTEQNRVHVNILHSWFC